MKIPKYKINNTLHINNANVSEQKDNKNIKFILPSNFSFYYDSTSKSYFFSFCKIEKRVKFTLKKKIKTNNVQNEFEIFMKELNEKYEHIKPIKFIINNTENIILYNFNEETDE